MPWYKIAEISAEKASLLMLDLSYYPAFLELKKNWNDGKICIIY